MSDEHGPSGKSIINKETRDPTLCRLEAFESNLDKITHGLDITQTDIDASDQQAVSDESKLVSAAQ